MRQSHLILSNAAIMWAARVLLMFPQLILIPFLIHRIGEDGYGVYVLAWSLMLSIDLFLNSLQQGVIKYSAAFLAKEQLDDVNKVVSSSFIYSILLAILACAGILTVAAFGDDQSGDLVFSLVVIAVMVFFMVPLTPYVAIIQSRQCYYVGAIADTLSKYIILFVVVVWFSTVGPSVKALIVISATMTFLSRLGQVPVAYRMVSGLQNRPTLFERKSFKLIASFGTMTVLIALCLIANNAGIKWLMEGLASTSFVGHLAIILMPGMLLSQIIQAATIVVMPATSAYEATGNRQMLKELLIRGSRYTIILALAAVIVAGLLMRNVLNVWVGPEFVFLAPYALVLFVSMSFMFSTTTGHHMLKGMGKLWTTVFISLVGLVIVPIALILIAYKVWHNPYVAVTSGLAVGHVVYALLQIGFGIKAVNTGSREFLMRAYAQPLMIAFVVCSLAYGAVTYCGIEYLTGRVLVSVVTLMLFFIGIYAFIASVAERQQLKGLSQLALSRLVGMRRISLKRLISSLALVLGSLCFTVIACELAARFFFIRPRLS